MRPQLATDEKTWLSAAPQQEVARPPVPCNVGLQFRVAIERGFRHGLRQVRSVDEHILRQALHRPDQVLWQDHPADPPPREAECRVAGKFPLFNGRPDQPSTYSHHDFPAFRVRADGKIRKFYVQAREPAEKEKGVDIMPELPYAIVPSLMEALLKSLSDAAHPD